MVGVDTPGDEPRALANATAVNRGERARHVDGRMELDLGYRLPDAYQRAKAGVDALGRVFINH
jgi:hypothetical protein